jgi:hypothetical protein
MSPETISNESSEAQELITEIENSIESGEDLTEEENRIIQSKYDKETTEEWKKAVRDYLKANYLKYSENVRKILIDEIELKSNYTMESLGENSDSEFFNIILKNKEALKVYSEDFIWKLIESDYKISPNNKTLDLVYWNKITKELWLKSVTQFAVDKVWLIFKWSVEEKDEIKKYLDSITKWYTENLNKLISIWNKNENWLKLLLDNPIALDSVLETWKYNKEGYNIDLSTWEVSFSENPDLLKSKKEFLDIAIKSTNESWKFLEDLKNKWEELISVFNKLWLNAETLRSFSDKLKDIPIIWKFLVALMWFFVSDSLLNKMDWNVWDKKFKTPWKSLQEFLVDKDNKENLPFKLEEDSFKDTSNIGAIEWFLWKVDDADKLNFENIVSNKKWDIEKEKRKEIINDKDFWKKIFSNENLKTEPILEQIRLKVQEMKKSGQEINVKDFFTELTKQEIDIEKHNK